MATLTQTAKNIRLMVNVILVFIILIIGFRVTYKIVEFFLPGPEDIPPKPDNALGKLSSPQFNVVGINPKATYNLDLIEASLPSSPTIMPVYKKIPYTIGLLSPERAKDIAKNLGFDPEQYEIVTPTLYKWNDLTLPRSVTIDLKTRKFTLTYDYQKDPSVFTQTAFRSDQDAQTKAIQILNQTKNLPLDITSGQQYATLLIWKENQLQNKGLNDTANAAQIYLQRENLKITPPGEKNEISYQVIGEIPEQGPISMLISSTPEKNKNILSLKFDYYTTDKESVGTYYIKTSHQAWEELNAGKVSPVVFAPPEGTNPTQIAIKSVYLAYYDQIEQQDYLQPIWVFVGEARLTVTEKVDFVAYIPAVTDDWLEKNQVVENETTP